mgnify:CR=1 FL=1
MDPTPTLEELYSLLLVIGHVLADEAEGETPVVLNYIKLTSGLVLLPVSYTASCVRLSSLLHYTCADSK